jgi:mRNA-degrading endonuclease RelE of RelBE toxin-antitoxin system
MSHPYDIRYADEAAADVRALRKSDQRKVVDGIEVHLTHEPKRVSKSRIKAMTQPFWSQYRLRIDDFRVYDDVDDSAHAVNVLRVLEKSTRPTPEKSP